MTSHMLDRQDFKDAIRHVVEEKIPFCKLLGIKLSQIDSTRPELSIDMRDDLLGNFTQEILHGGVIASLLDSVGGYAIMLKLAQEDTKDDLMAKLHEFARIGTIDLRIDFLNPGRGIKFIATADIARLGKRVANTQMRLHNDEGVLIATGSAAFILHTAKP